MTDTGRTQVVPLMHDTEGKYFLHGLEWTNLVYLEGLKKGMLLTFKYNDQVNHLLLMSSHFGITSLDVFSSPPEFRRPYPISLIPPMSAEVTTIFTACQSVFLPMFHPFTNYDTPVEPLIEGLEWKITLSCSHCHGKTLYLLSFMQFFLIISNPNSCFFSHFYRPFLLLSALRSLFNLEA